MEQTLFVRTLNSGKFDHSPAQPVMQRKRSDELLSGSRVETLRQNINDEDYLYAAIQRLALVMSNELMELNKAGGRYERKRRK